MTDGLSGLLALCLATVPAVTPVTLWQSWSLAPEIVVPLLLGLAAYARQAPRSTDPRQRRRWVLYGAGWLLLVVALVSPLCRAAATLAWAHMVQHMILVALAPPLLVLGLTPPRPGPARSRPLLVGFAYCAAIGLAHAPAVYEGALLDPVAHLALVAVLLAAGVAFWRVALAPLRGRSTPEACATGALLAFAAMVVTGLLGALLTLAGSPWFPIHGGGPRIWGLDPLDDQQLAGLIMWVPMAAVYVTACLALMARWLSSAGTTGDWSSEPPMPENRRPA
jgi:cytochrome c oxidase assembly factor CtaG